MSDTPLRGTFISPTGALAPECETAAIQQIMAFINMIDLEELADFDGDVRVDKYYDLYPEPEALRAFSERAKSFEGALFKVAGQGYEFADDDSEEAQRIRAFLNEQFQARQSHEEEILDRYPTALEAETFFEIEDRLRQKEKQEELQDLMDMDPDDIGEPAGFTLVYEGERSNGEKLKDFFGDFALVKALKEELPEVWADIEQKIARHADMVPALAPVAEPANG